MGLLVCGRGYDATQHPLYFLRTHSPENLLAGEAQAITRKCVDLAKQGDPTALKLCISRLIPTRQRSISLALPPLEGSLDSLQAINAVLGAVAAGEITPGEGTTVASLLETRRRAFEVEELENHHNALETQVCGAN